MFHQSLTNTIYYPWDFLQFIILPKNLYSNKLSNALFQLGWSGIASMQSLFCIPYESFKDYLHTLYDSRPTISPLLSFEPYKVNLQEQRFLDFLLS